MSDTQAVATPRAPGPDRARRSAASATTAVLLATAPAEYGGPAAAQPWAGKTVLRDLVDHLTDIGTGDIVVITRPGWEDALRGSLEGVPATVRAAASPSGDLAAIAAVAEERGGGMVVLQAEIVTQREALAGLLAHPGFATAILARAGAGRRGLVFPVRSRRGRVLSAGSPYHSVRRGVATFLGVLKVAPGDRAALAAVASRLSGLVAPEPPAAWQAELERKARVWRVALARRRARDEGGSEGVSAQDEAEVQRRLAAAPNDATSLLLVGLVREGVHVGSAYLRRLFWARPLSAEALARAAEDVAGYDEERALLDSAVKSSDGFFTTFFVSSYSRYLARWAARRGLTPNQVTVASMLIGLLAAAAFATGGRAGLIAGAVLLQASFTTDCVDGQLARYTRRFSRLGAWLDSIFDRAKEYAVFAGLAIGGEGLWVLAGAALTLQTARHMIDASFGATQEHAIGATRQPPLEQPSDRLGAGAALEAEESELNERDPVDDAPAVEPDPEPDPRPQGSTARRLARRGLSRWQAIDAAPGVRWAKKMIAFPIGERFAAISLTAAPFTAHTTFVVLLVWGGVAFCYTTAGRVLRSVAR